ncbi:MAG: class I SAM-dependent methyltransferase [Halobacteriota archaeon]
MKTIEHFKKLLHFALLEVRDELYRREAEAQAMRRYYASITIEHMRPFMSTPPARVLEVGGADGSLCKVFSEEYGAEVVNLEPDSERYRTQLTSDWNDTVCGGAQALPFADGAFDVVICRSVLEHIPPEHQQDSLDEMARVTRRGGLCYVAIPPWYNPFAGHHFRPFHLFPFKIARRLTLLCYPHPPQELRAVKSYADYGIFPITVRKLSRMIRASGFRILALRDVHFQLHFLTRIPIIREVAVPNVAFVLRK